MIINITTTTKYLTKQQKIKKDTRTIYMNYVEHHGQPRSAITLSLIHI